MEVINDIVLSCLLHDSFQPSREKAFCLEYSPSSEPCSWHIYPWVTNRSDTTKPALTSDIWSWEGKQRYLVLYMVQWQYGFATNTWPLLYDVYISWFFDDLASEGPLDLLQLGQFRPQFQIHSTEALVFHTSDVWVRHGADEGFIFIRKLSSNQITNFPGLKYSWPNSFLSSKKLGFFSPNQKFLSSHSGRL